MEIKLYFQMLRRGWWLIVLTAMAAVSISLALSYVAVPQFRASSSLIISPNASLTDSGDVVRSLDTLDRLSTVSTYAEVLGSNRMYQETLDTLNLTAEDLIDYTRTAVVLPDSSLLELSVTGPNPVVAADLANAISRQTINYTRQLNQIYDLNFLDTALVPPTPISPQPARDAVLALALGIAAGSLLAILLEQIRQPIDAISSRMQIDGPSLAYNRRYFQRLLEQTQARNQENVGLGLIHLEGLHNLIETMPSSVTQHLLHNVTSILREELRGNDRVGRWDAIQFAVMLPSTPTTAATRTLERIQQALSEPIYLEQVDAPILLEPCVGIVVSDCEESPQSLIERGEKALELARQKYMAQEDRRLNPATSR